MELTVSASGISEIVAGTYVDSQGMVVNYCCNCILSWKTSIVPEGGHGQIFLD